MKIGLALAGGGVKGAYQIGTYYAFKRCHIKFNGIVGTSIGAANGAVIASGHEKELLDMWKNLNPGELLELDSNLISEYNDNNKSKKLLATLKITKKAIKDHGFTTLNIKKLVTELVDINKILTSSQDFGLATYNFSKRKSIYIYKENMSKDNLVDYIIASCSLPVFKLDKVIDDSYYLDGGFHDNCPTNMLIRKHYDVVYEVKINGIGVDRKHISGPTKVITIIPSRDTGSIFEMNHDKIVDNINMGYFDTLKYLNKLLGYKYNFHKTIFFNYNHAVKNIDKFTLKRIYSFFNCNDNKTAIIKSLEYIMEKENYEYNNVYRIKQIIKTIPNNNHFIYMFIKGLSI